MTTTKAYPLLNNTLLIRCVITLVLVLLFTSNSFAAVIFSDNFDSYSWVCNGSDPGDWGAPGTCSSDTYGGIMHYCSEISSGGRTGNSLKVWKHGTYARDYCGLLQYSFSSSTYRDVYTRWYMKIPSDFSTSGEMNYLKLWRMYFGSGGELYFNLNGSSFSNAQFQIGDTVSSPAWHTVLTASEIPKDNAWHCWEVRVKLSSTGQSNGILQVWIDGVQMHNDTAVKFASLTSDYFTSTQLGIGNTAATSFQTSWRAIEFDDYVLSTTYVGTTGSVIPPEPEPTPDPTPTPTGYTEILNETWEANNVYNWDDDFVAGNTTVATNPVYSGSYAIKMQSYNPGNYAHFFGDHPMLSQPTSIVTDVTVEEYYYPSPGFLWPTGALKLWIMNCFESWIAGYNLAEGQDKPHTWAPYYMTIAVDGNGRPFGQLVRADGLGGTGDLWHDYTQNVGSLVSLVPGQWNKLKYRLRLNDLNQNNGVFQLWVNDVLKCDYSNMNFRGNYSRYGWNHLMMSMHPYPSSPQSQWISRDNIRILKGESSTSVDTTPPGRPTGVGITILQQ